MRNLKEYFRPSDVEEALHLKRQYGADAAYLAGGSDLMVHRPATLRAVIDIRHCGLGYTRQTADGWVIGGAALLRDAEKAVTEVAGGMLHRAFRDTAPWLIRNAATVAGNIANASPAADSVPALMVLDAQLLLGGGGRGLVALDEIFDAPHRTRLGDCLIQEIRIPSTTANRKAAFTKLARSASDIALVNLAVTLRMEGEIVREARIALGAVAPTPMRAVRTEALLENETLSHELLREAAELVRAEVQPISDWRASETYRRRMSGVLLRRALEDLGGMGNGRLEA